MPRPRKILPKKRERRHPLATGTGPGRVFDFIERNTTLRLLPWQREAVDGLYRLDEHGQRQVRRGYISVPRGNGKSALGAAVALFELFHPQAHVVVVASDTAQAKDIVFRQASELVLASEMLRRLAVVQRFEILVPSMRSRLQVLPADASGAQGYHPSCVIFDELHTQGRRDLWDTLSLGLAPGGLLVSMTTAGHDRESICYEVYGYAQKWRAGEVDDASFFALIYEADDTDEWTLETARTVNPGLGTTLREDEVGQAIAHAQEVPAALNSLLRYRFNKWTSAETRWLDPAVWAESGGPVEEQALVGAACWGGLDLSAVSDITALTLIFPKGNPGEELFYVVCRFWVSQGMMENPANRLRDTYAAWARQGYLTVTPGRAVNMRQVIEDIVALRECFSIRSLAVDEAFEGRTVEQELRARGVPTAGMRMTMHQVGGAALTFERLYTARRFRHGNHPILAWMAGNVEAKEGELGAMLPSKRASRDKIDGIVALILALDQHEKVRPSIYDRRGVLTA